MGTYWKLFIALLFGMSAAVAWWLATVFLIDELFLAVREVTGIPAVIKGTPVQHSQVIARWNGYGEIFAAIVLVAGAAPAFLIILAMNVWQRLARSP